VVDAELILADPRGQLVKLCAALAIHFEEAMLNWPAGPRETDGVWAAHWYDAVNRSTGFGGPRSMPQLDHGHLRAVSEQALPIYERLAGYALR
jgi:hypothetical protein